MVRPALPDSNPETADSNAFQRGAASESDRLAVWQEFDQTVAHLRAAGIEVVVFQEPVDDPCPDTIFPNNWFSTSTDEQHILYPMLSPARRRERRPDILRFLREHYPDRIDLTHLEEQSCFLEGTGSMVFDRVAKLAYASLSPRTSSAALEEWEKQTGWQTLRFRTHGPGGIPAYHTNVILAIGSKWAVVADDVIDPADRSRVMDRLAADRQVIRIQESQAMRFAGNILELQGSAGPVISISGSAFDALDSSQRVELERFGELIVFPVPTIERLGGGSIRCMIAELF